MLKIVKAEPLGTGFGIKTATIIVQGDTLDEVNSLAAKNLAYEEQKKLNMPNSGIESMGGSYPVEVQRTQEEINSLPPQMRESMSGTAYQKEFKLTQMI